MFKLEKFMGKRVLKSSLLDDEDVVSQNIVAFFTTRDLPLKCGEREDLKNEVEENKKLLARGLNIPFENIIIPNQTHSNNVAIVNGNLLNLENTDALITNQPNIALVLNFADCVPIIFVDKIKRVVAAAHAGWRGTAAKIAVKTLGKMIKEFSCNPEDITVLIGPAIGKCCFEVNEDVREQIISTLTIESQKLVYDKMMVDLKLVNKFQILESELASGLKKIDVCEDCTCCQNELFFSYRKENGNTARHSAVVMVNR